MPRLFGCQARISFRSVPLTDGDHHGTEATTAGVTYVAGREERSYADPHVAPAVPRPFSQARWTSPVVEPGFAFTELVPTWHARTPDASWMEVSARVRQPRAHDHSENWSRWL